MLSQRGARGVQSAELGGDADSENNHGGSSTTYVLHRTRCSQEDDQLLCQGREWLASPGRRSWATRWELDGWMKGMMTLPKPWTVAMEAMIFTSWIYDHLLSQAQQVAGMAELTVARLEPLMEDAPVFKAHYLLGTILEREGDKKAAAEQYRTALSLAKSFSPAQDALNRLNQNN
jgi:hypothetical protein